MGTLGRVSRKWAARLHRSSQGARARIEPHHQRFGTVEFRQVGSFQSAFHEHLVDDHLRGNIRQFPSLPGLQQFSHRLEVPLHPVHAHRYGIDEREWAILQGCSKLK